MEFKEGASVYSTEGKEVGKIDRVVINPKTKQITHIVIRKGFIFTRDKVVPIDAIIAGAEDHIILRLAPNRLDELPDYEETHYIVLNEEELGRNPERVTIGLTPALYQYPPYVQPLTMPSVEPAYVAETEVNIPEGTVAIKEGAKVISQDGKELGHVEKVMTDAESRRSTHFLISKGRVLKEKKLVPVEWIDSFDEDDLHLAVGASMIEQLPAYQREAVQTR
jgi:uncharacterized protein YrrD